MTLRDLLTLRFSDLIPESWRPASLRKSPDQWKGPGYRRNARYRLDLLFVTNHLATLVKSNAPLAAGIEEAVSLDAPNAKVEALLLTLREDLFNGSSLADAMAARPRFFPSFYVDLIRSGEKTGALADSLTAASDELLRRLDLRTRWTIFLTYIGLLYCVQLLILNFVIIKITPVYFEISNEFEGAGPRPAILGGAALAKFITEHPRAIAIVIASTAFTVLALYVILRRRRSVRMRFRGALSHLPVLGAIVVRQDLAHAGFVLEKYLAGGLPLPAALDKVAAMETNAAHSKIFERLRQCVNQGQTLKEAMDRESRLLPHDYKTIIGLGESSGRLPEAFRQMAEIYDREAGKRRVIVLDASRPVLLGIGGAFSLYGCYIVYGFSAAMVDALFASL